MGKVGDYTEQVKIIKNNLKSMEIIDVNGEIIELHNRTLENLSMDMVNLVEKLNERNNPNAKEIIEYQKSKDVFDEKVAQYLGGFYFNFYNRVSDLKIESQHMVRFLYLCSYLNYKNELIIDKTTRHYPIYESDLQDLLKISQAEVYRTKNKLINSNLLFIGEKGEITVNDKYCKKGTIPKNSNVQKVRIFDYGIKEIYEKALPREHKRLILLFELLPYVNLKFNVICKNPTEELMDNLQPYTIKELSKLLNKANVTRFKNNLLDITIDNSPVIMLNQHKNAEFITVNPSIYYKGGSNDIIEFDYLVGLFKIKSKSEINK